MFSALRASPPARRATSARELGRQLDAERCRAARDDRLEVFELERLQLVELHPRRGAPS